MHNNQMAALRTLKNISKSMQGNIHLQSTLQSIRNQIKILELEIYGRISHALSAEDFMDIEDRETGDMAYMQHDT